MAVDLSQLDLADVNLEDVDLSCISLETINLKGTYIDPKQLRSLQGLLYFQAIAKEEATQRLIAQKLQARYKEKEEEDFLQRKLKEREQENTQQPSVSLTRRVSQNLPSSQQAQHVHE